jgi:hypothetical protein
MAQTFLGAIREALSAGSEAFAREAADRVVRDYSLACLTPGGMPPPYTPFRSRFRSWQSHDLVPVDMSVDPCKTLGDTLAQGPIG